MITPLDITLLSLLVLAGLWTVQTRTVLRAAVGLALTSVVLTLLMFRLASPLAAVFELSVCAGLITAIFISVLSLVKSRPAAETSLRQHRRLKKYWLLPVLILALAGLSFFYRWTPELAPPPAVAEEGARRLLWTMRQTDLLGQILVLLAGVFGVVVLFQETKQK